MVLVKGWYYYWTIYLHSIIILSNNKIHKKKGGENMNKYIKLFSILALAILLTGCVDKQENTAAEVDEIAKNTVENIEEK